MREKHEMNDLEIYLIAELKKFIKKHEIPNGLVLMGLAGYALKELKAEKENENEAFKARCGIVK